MAREKTQPFFVTGMHRSGTTHVGRVLSCYPEVAVIHEPLNKEFGLANVAHVYPCDIDGRQKRHYERLLWDMMDGKADYVRHVEEESMIKSLARYVTGGRTGVDVAKFRLRKRVSSNVVPVLKDPFAVLMSHSLVQNGCRVVAIIRHPAAIWLSIKRMGWTFNPDDFACEQIFPHLSLPTSKEELSAYEEVNKIAWLWVVINSYVLPLLNHRNFLLVRHEDLCERPFEEFHRVENFFELEPSVKPKKFIAKNMFGKQVNSPGRKLHFMQRDSKKLAKSWHGRLTREEETVLENICGSLVNKFYGSWTPA